jgi:hypothetical protein
MVWCFVKECCGKKVVTHIACSKKYFIPRPEKRILRLADLGRVEDCTTAPLAENPTSCGSLHVCPLA